MLVGPLFTRETTTLPRRPRLYLCRAGYVFALWLLMATAWLVLTGTQIVRQVSDLARFGAILFQILAPLQLGLAIFFAALLTASAVCQEKDRRTLTLLLLTNLSHWELVVGKLLASLLGILVMLFGAVPMFLMIALFGGVSFGQIGRVFAVTLASVIVAGSLGATIAFWREKTFQALALTALILVFWLILWEVVASDLVSARLVAGRSLARTFSPWRALAAAMQPVFASETTLGDLAGPVGPFLRAAAGLVVLLNGLAIRYVRKWNSGPLADFVPARLDRAGSTGSAAAASASEPGGPEVARTGRRWWPAARSRRREVWDNPVLWRELCTWAYGRKILLIRAAYLLFFLLAAMLLLEGSSAAFAAGSGRSMLPPEAKPFVPLLVVSLVLVNALAVTSLTTERDGRAIDLLLVTDLTPKEFIFGKLGGVFYNTKEMVLLPMLLAGLLWAADRLSGENLLYLTGGLLVMNLFVAVLGIHLGMVYSNSRTAIGVSVGTVLFLFIGVATCMRMMIAFSGSFQVQLQPFVACMLGGGIALYYALGRRNPSAAITLASFLAPIATFHGITSFMIGQPGAVFVVAVGTYGFATAAMLVPALYEFDVATGRTTGERE